MSDLSRTLDSLGGSLERLGLQLGRNLEADRAVATKNEFDNAVVDLNEAYNSHYQSHVLNYDPENDPEGNPALYWENAPTRAGEAIDAAWQNIERRFTSTDARDAADRYYREFRSNRELQVAGTAYEQRTAMSRTDFTANVQSSINLRDLEQLRIVSADYAAIDPAYAAQAKAEERSAIYAINVGRLVDELNGMPPAHALDHVRDMRGQTWEDFDGNTQRLTDENYSQMVSQQESRLGAAIAEKNRQMAVEGAEERGLYFDRERDGSVSSHDLQHSPDFNAYRTAFPAESAQLIEYTLRREQTDRANEEARIEAEIETGKEQIRADIERRELEEAQAAAEAAADAEKAYLLGSQAVLVQQRVAGSLTAAGFVGSTDPAIQNIRLNDDTWYNSFYEKLLADERRAAAGNNSEAPTPDQSDALIAIKRASDAGQPPERSFLQIADFYGTGGLTRGQADEARNYVMDAERDPTFKAVTQRLEESNLPPSDQTLIQRQFEETWNALSMDPLTGQPLSQRPTHDEAMSLLDTLIEPTVNKQIARALERGTQFGPQTEVIAGWLTRPDASWLDVGEQFRGEVDDFQYFGQVNVPAVTDIISHPDIDRDTAKRRLLGRREERDLSPREQRILENNLNIAGLSQQYLARFREQVSTVDPVVYVDPTGNPFFRDRTTGGYWSLFVIDNDEVWHQWHEGAQTWLPREPEVARQRAAEEQAAQPPSAILPGSAGSR